MTPSASARAVDAALHHPRAMRFAALAQRARERSADQADAKNHQLVKRESGHVNHTEKRALPEKQA
jgi:hypothetical protein